MASKLPDIEPSIYRQRLVLEGHFNRELSGEDIKGFLQRLSEVLDMSIFAGPFCWPPDKWTNMDVNLKLNDWNGFVAWTESGCHIYTWEDVKFFTIDMYSCKPFDVKKVLAYVTEFYVCDDLVWTEV